MQRKWQLITGVLVLLVGMGVWGARDRYATARIGTTYVAKQTCSCLFVAGRPLDSCSTDYDPESLQSLNVVTGNSAVTVSALGGLISARAEFENGFGCHPVK